MYAISLTLAPVHLQPRTRCRMVCYFGRALPLRIVSRRPVAVLLFVAVIELWKNEAQKFFYYEVVQVCIRQDLCG